MSPPPHHADAAREIGKRHHARARLGLGARLVTFAGSGPCVLLDLSCTGARLAACELPRVGAMAVVEDLPVELFGTVRWVADGRFGIEFEALMPLGTVVAMRRYADDEQGRIRREQLSFAQAWVAGTV